MTTIKLWFLGKKLIHSRAGKGGVSGLNDVQLYENWLQSGRKDGGRAHHFSQKPRFLRASNCFCYLEYPPVDLKELQERKEALKEANDKLGSSLIEEWTVNIESKTMILQH